LETRRLQAFRLLGIPADSDRATVTHAYRRLARVTHPDVSRDPQAAHRFAVLTRAYRLLVTEHQPTSHQPSSADVDLNIDLNSDLDIGADPAPADRSRVARSVDGELVDAWATARPGSLSAGRAPWQRPPIVAGPVRIRPPARGERTGGT
jgi:curved DNA-binding protein CbpA